LAPLIGCTTTKVVSGSSVEKLSNSDTSDSCYSLRKIADYTSQLSRKRWGEMLSLVEKIKMVPTLSRLLNVNNID
jgi:hypothetical protein